MKKVPSRIFSLAFLASFFLISFIPVSYAQQAYILKFADAEEPLFKNKRLLEKDLGAKMQLISGTSYAKVIPNQEKNLGSFSESEQIQALLDAGVIVDIEENLPFSMSSLPNDEYLHQQWGVKYSRNSAADIDLEQAWKLQRRGEGIMGVIDTGIDYAHPDLVKNIWQNLAEDADGDNRVLEFINGKWQLDPGDLDGIDADGNGYVDDLVGWDFVNNDNDPFDDNGHGTHVAGIAAARGNNRRGIAGVAWQAEIMVLKAFDRYGSGQLSTVLPAIEYARKMGVFLTNNSWGGSRFSKFLREEIQASSDKGQIFVAAAGNTGLSYVHARIYPAAYPISNLVSVGASNMSNDLAGFSSSDRKRVDIFAPGKNILSCLPRNRYGRKSGTSMAAPFVSGALLLLHAHEPTLSSAQMIRRLLANVDHGDKYLGQCKSNGKLNVFQSLSNMRGERRSQILWASYRGINRGCVNKTYTFRNNSFTPLPSQTKFSWFVNGKLVSRTRQLEYKFEKEGWYNLRLVTRDPNTTEVFQKPIQILPSLNPDLGNDTSICAKNYLLFAGSVEHNVRWKRLICEGNADCKYFTRSKLEFPQLNRRSTAYSFEYFLINPRGIIREIRSQPKFSPVAIPGNYKAYRIRYKSGPKKPRGFKVGNKISDIKLGGNIRTVLSRPLRFNLHKAELLGNEAYLLAKESGTYVLQIDNACGNWVSDTLNLKLTGSCVWPGDVNNDGHVSMLDFLSLGLANGKRGPARRRRSTAWRAHPARNWSSSFHPQNALSPNLNHKYADCNGDGVVDLSTDYRIIRERLGFYHSADVARAPGSLSFQLKHMNTTYSKGGDSAFVEVGFFLEGEDRTLVRDFYGMAVTLNFSDPIMKSPSLKLSQGWLGPTRHLSLFAEGEGALSNSRIPDNQKSVSLGLVSANRNPFQGKGYLASGIVIVTIDDVVDGKENKGIGTFSISSSDLIVIDSKGRALSIGNAGGLNVADVELERKEKTSDETNDLWGFKFDQDTDGLLAYPNPTNSELSLEYAVKIPQSAKIMIKNSLGQIIWRSEQLQEQGKLSLDASSWPQGLYFASLYSEEGIQTLKFLKN